MCVLLSILNVTFLIRNVQTSSQKRYVSSEPWAGQLVYALAVGVKSAGPFIHLEREAGLNLLIERVGHDAVKLHQDLHGQLRIDPLVLDQVIEGISQGHAETAQSRYEVSTGSLVALAPNTEHGRRRAALARQGDDGEGDGDSDDGRRGRQAMYLP